MSESATAADDAAAHVALREAMAALALPEPERLAELIAQAAADRAALAAAIARCTGANDFEAAMGAAVDVVLAAEAAAGSAILVIGAVGTLRGLARDAEQRARIALGSAMAAAGVGAVRTPHHQAEPAAQRARVEVEEPGLLPARFWRQPDPEPDKAKLAAALRHGPVAGARLVGGAAGVRISNRKDSR